MLEIRYREGVDSDKLKLLTSHKIHPVVGRAIIQRGVEDVDVALLRHKLLPYKKLKGVNETAVGLAKAILKKEKIVVVADYDCDGATACAVAVSGLKELGADIDFVVPNRMIHGYGLTPSVVELAQEKNPRWIVTVDNGIASVEGVRAANERGIGVWVTDHHLPGDTLPDACGIVNPNQPGCEFESKNIAGCGVMFYVLAAVRDCLKANGCEKAKNMDVSKWLDLVALGTVADVVKLDDNNRWLVNQGLIRIRQGEMRPGIKALFDVSGKNSMMATSQDFGFGLGPRLNAAGRLEDMSIGIRCLLSNDYEEALHYAKQLNELNERRKEIEKEMKESAWKQVDTSNQKDNFTRVVFGEDFHEGVIGIVAGRIKEEDYAPTIVFAPSDDGGWKGSGRAIPGLHLRDVLDMVYKKHPNWFVKFGGHAMAAGMSLTKEATLGFADEFEMAVRQWFDHRKPEQYLLVDDELDYEFLTIQTALALAGNVWGQGFNEPVWTGDFEVLDVKMVGEDKNHLKMTLATPGGSNGQTYTAMHFFQEEDDIPVQGDEISIAYQLKLGEFRGEMDITLIVMDRRVAGAGGDLTSETSETNNSKNQCKTEDKNSENSEATILN